MVQSSACSGSCTSCSGFSAKRNDGRIESENPMCCATVSEMVSMVSGCSGSSAICICGSVSCIASSACLNRSCMQCGINVCAAKPAMVSTTPKPICIGTEAIDSSCANTMPAGIPSRLVAIRYAGTRNSAPVTPNSTKHASKTSISPPSTTCPTNAPGTYPTSAPSMPHAKNTPMCVTRYAMIPSTMPSTSIAAEDHANPPLATPSEPSTPVRQTPRHTPVTAPYSALTQRTIQHPAKHKTPSTSSNSSFASVPSYNEAAVCSAISNAPFMLTFIVHQTSLFLF